MSGAAYPLGLDRLNAVSQVAAQELIFRRLMAGTATAKLVKVLSCTNIGAAAAAGEVNVQPLVNQIDGSGNVTPHGTVYSLPYFRLQGGTSAIILDPVAGDIGVAVFCDRDISSVKRSKAQANPGSRRMFDMADGLYLGGFLNAIPVQFLQFNSTGVTVKDISGSEIVMAGGTITLAPADGLVVIAGQIAQTAGPGGQVGESFSGAVNAIGDVVGGSGSGDPVSLQLHLHPGVTAGGADTGPPVPGT